MKTCIILGIVLIAAGILAEPHLDSLLPKILGGALLLGGLMSWR